MIYAFLVLFATYFVIKGIIKNKNYYLELFLIILFFVGLKASLDLPVNLLIIFFIFFKSTNIVKKKKYFILLVYNFYLYTFYIGFKPIHLLKLILVEFLRSIF